MSEPLDISGLWEAVAIARYCKGDSRGFQTAARGSRTRLVVEHWERNHWHDKTVYRSDTPQGRGWHDATLGFKLP